MKKILLCFLLIGTVSISGVVHSSFNLNRNGSDQDKITIHAAEIGVGKFHRYDNSIHPYQETNGWKAFILEQNAGNSTPQIIDHKNKSYTIFFSNLEELMTSMIKISKDQKALIELLTINAHGIPGGMWFPKDKNQQNSFECSSWRSSAASSDRSNYNQYYSAVSKDEIFNIRRLSENQFPPHYQCINGYKEWEEIILKHPEIKEVFAPEAQIHLLSCVAGLGRSGEYLSKQLTSLLFKNNPGALVQSSFQFGLGDWSMPEGMGFWDYLNDQQIEDDESRYPAEKTDRNFRQKGDIRVSQMGDNAQIRTGIIKQVDFMLLSMDQRSYSLYTEPLFKENDYRREAPKYLRIPGTSVVVKVVE